MAGERKGYAVSCRRFDDRFVFANIECAELWNGDTKGHDYATARELKTVSDGSLPTRIQISSPQRLIASIKLNSLVEMLWMGKWSGRVAGIGITGGEGDAEVGAWNRAKGRNGVDKRPFRGGVSPLRTC